MSPDASLLTMSLRDASRADAERVGGKARVLGALAASGVRVPRGFVLPVDAFSAFLRRSDLWELASTYAERPETAAAQRLCTSILSADLAPAASWAIAAVGHTASAPWVVRSSAVSEDAPHSAWAGVFESIVGVDTADLPSAVRQVWASLYGPRAHAVYRRLGRGPTPGAMAVLIQELLDAEASGVLFTIDPMRGSWREMVVEAVRGLAGPLAEGRVVPDRFVVRRPRRRMNPMTLAWSRVRLRVVDADRPEPREPPVLDPEAICRLCRIGLDLEYRFGTPQDVEWVRDRRGAFHVVQSRAITTLGSHDSAHRAVWTDRFLRERWPRGVSPLGWSIVEPSLSHHVHYPGTSLRFWAREPALRRVWGIPEVQVAPLAALGLKLPGRPPLAFVAEVMPDEVVTSWRRRWVVWPRIDVVASLIAESVRDRRWNRFAWEPTTHVTRWHAFVRAARPDVLRVLVASPGREVEQVDALRGRLDAYVGIHVVSLLYANLAYQFLATTLSRAVPAEADVWLDRLAVSAPGNATMLANRALSELAFAATDSDLEALGSGQIPDPESDFGRAWDVFVRRFGRRAETSWEIWSARWAEDPAGVAKLLALDRPSGIDAGRDRQEQAWRDAVAALATRLGPVNRAQVLGAVYHLRRYLLLRENQRAWFESLAHAMASLLRDLASRLVREARLASADDLGWLSWGEVRALSRGALSARDARVRIDARRAGASKREVAPDPELPHRLVGTGVSAGRHEGVVRVVRTAADLSRVCAGDVIVTCAIDPGWTPVFLTAGAVVSELGGCLSHGAILAREYGVPMVVGVADATVRLRDGESVRVDGRRGEVRR